MKRSLSTITARSLMIFALATSALTSGGAQAHAAEDPNWLHSTYGPYSTQQACINAPVFGGAGGPARGAWASFASLQGPNDAHAPRAGEPVMRGSLDCRQLQQRYVLEAIISPDRDEAPAPGSHWEPASRTTIS